MSCINKIATQNVVSISIFLIKMQEERKKYIVY